MKLAYLSFNDPFKSPGVHRKEKEFCRALQEECVKRDITFRGIDIFTSDRNHNLDDLQTPEYQVSEVGTSFYRKVSAIPLVCSLFRTGPIYREAYSWIDRFRPDVIIWRFNVTYTPGFFNPKKITGTRLITEHQSNEIRELRMTPAGRLVSPVIDFIAKHNLKNADAVIGVTTEIARHEVSKADTRCLSFTLTNSISVSNYPLKKQSYSPGKIEIVFTGSHTAPWHGIDRLLKGIADYDGPVKIGLHLVGDATVNTQDFNIDPGVDITRHGYCSGRKLDAIYDQADIAIGTLALHRQGLRYGSTLKVREYMARGIPFILGYNDEDLENTNSFFFSVPSDDSPVDIEEIIDWTGQFYTAGEKNSIEMRRFAENNLDYKNKIPALLDFCRRVNNTCAG